jgi:hypothetical protein
MNATETRTEHLDYPDYVQALRARWPELAEELAGFEGVEDVLRWMQRRGLCPTPVDIVGQDEFSYDFLVRFEPPDGWLAFGVT